VNYLKISEFLFKIFVDILTENFILFSPTIQIILIIISFTTNTLINYTSIILNLFTFWLFFDLNKSMFAIYIAMTQLERTEFAYKFF